MKKILSVLLCALLSGALITGCGGSKQAASQTVAPGVLNVVILDGKDRYATSDGTNVTGIEADLAGSVAETLGLNLQVTPVEDSDAFFAGLSNGQYDLGFGRIPETDLRNPSMTVSRSYGRGSVYILTPRYDYMTSLNQMTIGKVGISLSVEPLADRVSGIDAVERESFTDLNALSAAVLSGDIGAALVNEREAVSLISEDLQAQELYGSPTESYVAVMPPSSGLKNTVDNVIGAYYNALIGIGNTGENPEQKEQ